MNLTEAKGFVHRLRGYMFCRAANVDAAIFFRNCRSVHTCFMFFDLSLYVIDKHGMVLQVEHALKPWRFRLYQQGTHIVEVPSTQLAKLGFNDVRPGSKINVDI